MLTLYTNNPTQKRENLCQTKPYGIKRDLLIALCWHLPNKAGINPACQYKIDMLKTYFATCMVSIFRAPLVTCTTFSGNGVSQVGLPNTCINFLMALKIPSDTQA